MSYYTDADDAFIRDNLDKGTVFLSAKMGRSRKGIRHRIGKLGLSVPHPSPWTPEARAFVEKSYGKGLSAAEIAKQLGPEFTRAAVIGHAHRAGLTGEGAESTERKAAESARRAAVARQRAERDRARAAKAAAKAAAKLATPARKPKRVEPVTPYMPANPKTLFDLDRLDCRFPVAGDGADTLFCAEPVVGETSWCPHCSARAFTKAPEKFVRKPGLRSPVFFARAA